MLTVRGTGFQPSGIISEISCLFDLFGDNAVVQPPYISDKEMHCCESRFSAKTGSILFRVVIADGYMQSASSSVHYVEVYSVLYIQSFQMKAIQLVVLKFHFWGANLWS